MPKLKLVKAKPSSKGKKEIWQDANDMFSSSPNSKQERRMYTPEEIKETGRPHGGKYR